MKFFQSIFEKLSKRLQSRHRIPPAGVAKPSIAYHCKALEFYQMTNASQVNGEKNSFFMQVNPQRRKNNMFSVDVFRKKGLAVPAVYSTKFIMFYRLFCHFSLALVVEKLFTDRTITNKRTKYLHVKVSVLCTLLHRDCCSRSIS